MRFLSRIFLNAEAKQALAALDAICGELRKSGEVPDGFDSLLAIDTIYKQVHDTVLRSSNEVRDSFLQNNETPNDFIWKILGHYSRDHITSGRNHFYRGSLNGRGIMYEKIFLMSLKQLVESGKATQEQINRVIKDVKAEIDYVG